MELLLVPVFAFLMFIRGFGRDELPWYNPWNLFTSKGAVSTYTFAILAAYSGAVWWPIATAIGLLAATWVYDKGELLSWKIYFGSHKLDTSKIAYWIANKPLKRLQSLIGWEATYGVAAGLPYVLAMAPWGMPLLPLLYGVIYKHSPNDEVGRTLLGLCMGLTFIL